MNPVILATDDYPDTEGLIEAALTHAHVFEFSCNHESAWGRENGWILNCRRVAGHELPHISGFTFMARWDR